MTEQNDDPIREGLLDYLKSALSHAFEVVRSYLALFGADAEERAERLLRYSLWFMALLAMGILGLVFLATGASQAIEAVCGRPGMGIGKMIVGGVLVGLFVIAAVVEQRGRK